MCSEVNQKSDNIEKHEIAVKATDELAVWAASALYRFIKAALFDTKPGMQTIRRPLKNTKHHNAGSIKRCSPVSLIAVWQSGEEDVNEHSGLLSDISVGETRRAQNSDA